VSVKQITVSIIDRHAASPGRLALQS
jgi:hypothetical protein